VWVCGSCGEVWESGGVSLEMDAIYKRWMRMNTEVDANESNG
jgi:hypothetical protein